METIVMRRESAIIAAPVDEHLEMIGFVWN